MKEIRPTAAAIEAALSAYDFQHKEGALDDDSLDFIRITWSNERLKAELHGAADFVSEIELPAGLEDGVEPEVIRLYKVNVLFHMFFWVGWHSRGALEEDAQLKRLVR